MKKKKKNTDAASVTPSRIENQRKRRQEKLAKEEQERENSRNALFRKRVREASEKKAPQTLRTKAYYRFSSEYPSLVNPDGFRENSPEKKKLSVKKTVMLLICCILVFALTFVAVKSGMLISQTKLPEDGTAVSVAENEAVTALHITYEELASLTADELTNKIKSANCNTAVFEFKSDYGYVFFDINSFLGSSADKKISDAWDKVKEIKENGIKCAAYISCFRDNCAALSLTGLEVTSSSGLTFRDADNSCWLDPFSDDAQTYILNIIKKAADGNFDYILLDNVSYPYKFSDTAPIYKTTDSSSVSKNGRLISFINEAVKYVGSDRLILLCDISGFCSMSALPNEKYGDILIKSDCIAYALELRSKKQYEEQLINTDIFNYIEEMPLAFILDAGSLAVQQLKNTKEASVSLAIVDRYTEDAKEFTVHSGIENVIIW